YGQLDPARKRRTIVVQNAKHLFITAPAVLRKVLDESWFVFLAGVISFDAEETAVDKDYQFFRHKQRAPGFPEGSAETCSPTSVADMELRYREQSHLSIHG